MQKLFYPKWWLDLTGFFNNPPAIGPNTLQFLPNPNTAPGGMGVPGSGASVMMLMFITLFFSTGMLAVGIVIGKIQSIYI